MYTAMKSPVCDEELDPTQRGIAPYSSDLFSDLTEQAWSQSAQSEA